ncbi:uncharacterized protein LOC141647089 [Silene latifolia]|uniref:uncharacterized protein LOC141647089 n=1 Tax=Silene latifolia TaxID=37657 RepID=UPI003D78366F
MKLKVSSSTSLVRMNEKQHSGITDVRAPGITDIAPKFHYVDKEQHSGSTDVRAARITDIEPPLKYHLTDEGQHSGATDVRAARITDTAQIKAFGPSDVYTLPRSSDLQDP